MADFLHGIEHINVTSDTVPVNDIVTAVIGLVGTADKGDTNVLTLCKSAADDAAFGTKGTIPEALKAIRMQDSTAGSALVFVVKVKDATAEITAPTLWVRFPKRVSVQVLNCLRPQETNTALNR